MCVPRGYRHEVERVTSQVSADMSGINGTAKAADLKLRKDLKDLQSMAQKGLLTLRSELEKTGAALLVV